MRALPGRGWALRLGVAALLGGLTLANPGAANAQGNRAQDVIRDTTGSTAQKVPGDGVSSANWGRLYKATTPGGKELETYQQSSGDSRSAFVVLDKDHSTAKFSGRGLLAPGERFADPESEKFAVVDPKNKVAVPADVVVVNAANKVTKIVDAAWAKDVSTGKSLATSYKIADNGASLVQNVDTRQATGNVVADPRITTGVWDTIPVYYVLYTWTETTRAYRAIVNGGAGAPGLCGFIPNRAIAALCLTVTSFFMGDLVSNLKAAIAEKRCLKQRLPALGGAIFLYVYNAYRKTCIS